MYKIVIGKKITYKSHFYLYEVNKMFTFAMQ